MSATPKELQAFVEKASNPENRIGLVVRDYLEALPEPLADLVTVCSIPHFFDLELAESLGQELGVPMNHEAYQFLLRVPFVEASWPFGHAVKDSVRDVIIRHLWEERRDLYVRASQWLASLMKIRIDREIAGASESQPRSRSARARTIHYYQREWLYHMLVANEADAIREIIDFLNLARAQSQISNVSRLLEGLSEHQNTGRATGIAQAWLMYWNAGLAKDRGDFEKETDLLRQCHKVIEAESISDPTLQALAGNALGNSLARLGAQDEGWREFLSSRSILKTIHGVEIPRLLLIDDSSNAIDFEHPTPSDWLWLGLNIPGEPAPHLIGRERELDILNSWLQQKNQPHVMVVRGLGGIGKTALAYELARSALKGGVIDRLFWSSSKKATLVGQSVEHMPDRASFHDFLASALREIRVEQTGTPLLGPAPRPTPESLSDLKGYLMRHRALLVFDNIETMDDLSELSTLLPDLLGRSRAIVTSRHPLSLMDSQVLTLNGLDEQSSLKLIQLCRRAMQLPELNPRFARDMCRASGGHPLAITQTLLSLKSVGGKDAASELPSPNRTLLDFVYMDDWGRLSPDAKQLLFRLSLYGSQVVIPTTSLISDLELGLSQDRVSDAIFEAEELSFLGRIKDPNSHRSGVRIGALAQQFIQRATDSPGSVE